MCDVALRHWVEIPGVSNVPVDHSTLEDEDDKFLRNVVNELPSDTASLPTDWDSRVSEFVGKKSVSTKESEGLFQKHK